MRPCGCWRTCRASRRLPVDLTPIVLVAGLLLAALLASVTRGHRRTLDVERAQAIHTSLHDALTGLPNRTLLANRVDLALRGDSPDGTTALLLIDLDRFKEVNDTFGHHYGNQLLIQVGPRLTSPVRDGDTVARLGGDEFAVLLRGVGCKAHAKDVAVSIRGALEALLVVDGVALDVEASIGLVVSGDHGNDTSVLLQQADIARYVAKDQDLGVFVYDAAADGHSPSRLAVLGDLKRALERDELVLHHPLLEMLSALGVRISIDDFGVGYTSLGQLKTLPVGELKIDRSFVMTMVEDRSNAVIVHSVVDLGHSLGLTIVAEGSRTRRRWTPSPVSVVTSPRAITCPAPCLSRHSTRVVLVQDDHRDANAGRPARGRAPASRSDRVAPGRG